MGKSTTKNEDEDGDDFGCGFAALRRLADLQSAARRYGFRASDISDVPQDAILRYGRLEICATPDRSGRAGSTPAFKLSL